MKSQQTRLRVAYVAWSEYKKARRNLEDRLKARKNFRVVYQLALARLLARMHDAESKAKHRYLHMYHDWVNQEYLLARYKQIANYYQHDNNPIPR